MEATATFKTTLFLSYSEFIIASLQYAFLLTLETSNTMENNAEQRALELVKSEDTKKAIICRKIVLKEFVILKKMRIMRAW